MFLVENFVKQREIYTFAALMNKKANNSMKRLFILLSTILCVTAVHAQESVELYRPFIEEGKQWVMRRVFLKETLSQCIMGDTVVGGISCKKWLQENPYYKSDEMLSICAYEEDRKVWFFYDGETLPRLMFDFAAQAGDTLIVFPPDPFLFKNVQDQRRMGYASEILPDTLIISKDMAEWGGSYMQRKIWFRRPCTSTSDFDYLMEGIGSHFLPSLNSALRNSTSAELVCCQVYDEILYFDRELASALDIPIPDGIQDRIFRSSNARALYDLAGRRLSDRPTKGLYIEDGKVRVGAQK